MHDGTQRAASHPENFQTGVEHWPPGQILAASPHLLCWRFRCIPPLGLLPIRIGDRQICIQMRNRAATLLQLASQCPGKCQRCSLKANQYRCIGLTPRGCWSFAPRSTPADNYAACDWPTPRQPGRVWRTIRKSRFWLPQEEISYKYQCFQKIFLLAESVIQNKFSYSIKLLSITPGLCLSRPASLSRENPSALPELLRGSRFGHRLGF